MRRFRGNTPASLCCLGCGRQLGEVAIDRDGDLTILELIGSGGARAEALQARVECPDCHAVRAFYSAPVPAVYAPPVLR